MSKRVQNENGSHSYINNKGEVVPTVTTILDIINEGEGLKIWANSLGLDGIRYMKAKSYYTTLGSAVHALIAHKLGGLELENIDIGESSLELKRNIAILYKYFMQWAEQCKPKMLKNEYVVIGDRYGGTIDAIFEQDGKIILGDFKTSKYVFYDKFLQLGGYLNILEETKSKLYKKITHCQIIACNIETGITVTEIPVKKMTKYRHGMEYAYALYTGCKLLDKEFKKDAYKISLIPPDVRFDERGNLINDK